MTERLRKYGDEFSRLILSNITSDGFMVLQQALASGSQENVAAVIRLLQADASQVAFKANLYQANRFGYNCLHQAANTPNADNYKLVKMIVEGVKGAFGTEGHDILLTLIKDKAKFRNKKFNFQRVNQVIEDVFPAKAAVSKNFLPSYTSSYLNPRKRVSSDYRYSDSGRQSEQKR